ncbi:MAG: hypothetical protein KY469_08775 [Actinobacteria bacterium]|nr:hypothetical protein [Actinomycetota bacterium]
MLSDRAGMNAVWVREEGSPSGDLTPTVKVLASKLQRAQIGFTVDVSTHGVEEVANIGRAAAGHHNVEIGLATAALGRSQSSPPSLGPFLRVLLTAWQHERRPRLSVVATGSEHVAEAVRYADDVVLPVTAIPDVAVAVRQVHRACTDGGRPTASLGIALEAPVSIGRTHAEALARAENDRHFSVAAAASPVGIIGRLEDCQERVIELAHLGVTDLRCVLPDARDIHDAIAQLNAMVIGSRDLLAPGAPRSKDPDPPAGWGGPPRSA